LEFDDNDVDYERDVEIVVFVRVGNMFVGDCEGIVGNVEGGGVLGVVGVEGGGVLRGGGAVEQLKQPVWSASLVRKVVL
jgi:hypothetical protein